MTGRGNGVFATGVGNTTIPSGAEIKAQTDSLSLDTSLTELNDGSWAILELPGFANVSAGTERSSLDALRSASDTSYYRQGDTLWVKVVASDRDLGNAGPFPGFGGGTTVSVSRAAGAGSAVPVVAANEH